MKVLVTDFGGVLCDSVREGFTVAFRAAWEPGKRPPHEMPPVHSLGINRGPEISDPTETVERQQGAVRAILKIFYEEQPRVASQR